MARYYGAALARTNGKINGAESEQRTRRNESQDYTCWHQRQISSVSLQ